CSFFFFLAAACISIYPLSLHDALPFCLRERDLHAGQHRPAAQPVAVLLRHLGAPRWRTALSRFTPRLPASLPARDRLPLDLRLRSEVHTSELQSRFDLECHLLLQK